MPAIEYSRSFRTKLFAAIRKAGYNSISLDRRWPTLVGISDDKKFDFVYGKFKKLTYHDIRRIQKICNRFSKHITVRMGQYNLWANMEVDIHEFSREERGW